MAALESVINETFDIVLTDIRMPGMDGPAFYDEACAKKPLLRDRFIFITGDSLNQRASNFIETTKAPYIIKPFKIADLDKAINEISSRSSLAAAEVNIAEVKKFDAKLS